MNALLFCRKNIFPSFFCLSFVIKILLSQKSTNQNIMTKLLFEVKAIPPKMTLEVFSVICEFSMNPLTLISQSSFLLEKITTNDKLISVKCSRFWLSCYAMKITSIVAIVTRKALAGQAGT